MKKIIPVFLTVFTIFLGFSGFGQSNNATLRGVVKDQNNNPLDMVNISLKDYPIGTSSNRLEAGL